MFELFFSLYRPKHGLLATIHQTKEVTAMNKRTSVAGNFGGNADAAV